LPKSIRKSGLKPARSEERVTRRERRERRERRGEEREERTRMLTPHS
jgi:hypothetical protein